MEKMEKARRLSVKEASYILDRDERRIRRAMRQGTLPIGFVEKVNNRYKYTIYAEKVESFLGREHKTPANE